MKESRTEDEGVRFKVNGWHLHDVVLEPELGAEGSVMAPLSRYTSLI